jgi:hypothetical protein
MMVPKPTHPVIVGCVEACLRCLDTAWRVAEARGDAYSEIGPHLRHCLDHITCLLSGLETGIVDYDNRKRDTALETDPVLFGQSMESAIERIASLKGDGLTRPLHVLQIPATAAERVIVHTTLERELLFISSHTIHHLATVLLIAERRGITLPESVGVAYSTAAYRASLAQVPA